MFFNSFSTLVHPFSITRLADMFFVRIFVHISTTIWWFRNESIGNELIASSLRHIAIRCANETKCIRQWIWLLISRDFNFYINCSESWCRHKMKSSIYEDMARLREYITIVSKQIKVIVVFGSFKYQKYYFYQQKSYYQSHQIR